MTPARLSKLVAEAALAEQRSLGPMLADAHRGLGGFPVRAVEDAGRGDLDAALGALGFSKRLRSVALAWPAALKVARSMHEEASRPWVSVNLGPLAVYWALAQLVVGVTWSMLQTKIGPVLEKMHADYKLPISLDPDLASFIVGTLVTVSLILWGLGGLYVSGAPLLGGWKRKRDAANDALAAAAMARAGAPTEVLQKWIAGQKALEKLGTLDEVTLLAHSTTWRRDAQRSVERCAAWLRYAVLACLVLQALTITACVYLMIGTASAWIR